MELCDNELIYRRARAFCGRPDWMRLRRTESTRGPRTRRGPTNAELRAAANRKVPDVIAPNLKVLFCGINPGLYSAFTGHHFARPGNRFWPALFAGGFTSRLILPSQEHELLEFGFGITNLIDRATAMAGELSREELVVGAEKFRRKVRRYRPRSVVILGISAYRVAFGCPEATVGLQSERLEGARVGVLPNPSGLNAHFTPGTLAKVFGELRLKLSGADL